MPTKPLTKMDLYHRALNLKWMVGLPHRVQNVIAAYGCEQIVFNKNKFIADVKKGKFLREAKNAGPVTVDIIKAHLGIKDNVELIEGVAIIQDGELYQLPKPNRHHHLIRLIFDKTGKTVNGEQGFITSTKRFVTRTEGLIVAKKAKQLLPRHEHQYHLFSESVW